MFNPKRYAAFLRGVMPVNCKMVELKRCFEEAGFTEVKTILGSGNVVFNTKRATESALRKRIEKAMETSLGRTFPTVVRSVESLEGILKSDPYARFRLKPEAKRIVTFLFEPPAAKLDLPIELDGARILAMKGCEVFSAYLPNPRGPVFMTLLERTFGKDQTTRTWDTVQKVARA